MTKKKIACVIGTRPEVIKMAPIIHLLRNNEFFTPFVICTAQHRALGDTMLKLFNITPDVDLDIMQHNQPLSELTGNLFLRMSKIFNEHEFYCLLAQGDTTTTFVSGMLAFYHKIRFGHVEAGLRSHHLYQPFPEEINRVLASHLASWHFTPTEREKQNLLKEGINEDNVFITGNTVIDALYELLDDLSPLPFTLLPTQRLILLTLHRRESFGEPIKKIFQAVKELLDRFDDIVVAYPVHPNPNVQAAAHDILGETERVHLLPPQPYDVFVTMMKQSYLILSDSGGIQEEAPALHKPVLILREVTERPLVVEENLAVLVGSNTQLIVEIASSLLQDEARYQSMQKPFSPYGDGLAAKRIVDILEASLIGAPA